MSPYGKRTMTERQLTLSRSQYR